MNSNLPEWSPRQLWFCWYQTLMTDKWISCYFDCFCVGRKWTRHSRWLNHMVSNVPKLCWFYHTWRSTHFKLKLFHPVLHDICFIWCYCCCCALSQSAVKIPERFASVVDPDRHYWWDEHTLCYGTVRNVHLTMVLFRAKSFQIGLIHSLLCLWQLSPTYIIYVW